MLPDMLTLPIWSGVFRFLDRSSAYRSTVKKSRFLDIPHAIIKILPIFLFCLGEAMFVDIIRLFRGQQKLIVINKNKIGFNVNMYFVYFIVLSVQILKTFS